MIISLDFFYFTLIYSSFSKSLDCVSGHNSFMWLGPKPAVFILEPELVKEVMVKYTIFQKPHSNALTKLLAEGLVSYEGHKWTKHRKIITPAFHVEKLKVKFTFA